MYTRGAQAVILVYDITKKITFENLRKWYQIVVENGNEHTIFVVVGNKEDLVDKELVPLDEARRFAKRIKGIYKKTSAKNNFGINDLFTSLAQKIYSHDIHSRESSSRLELLSQDQVKPKKSCCS